jgi:hypothetical protein
MKKLNFIGIDVDEIAPNVTFCDTLGMTDSVFRKSGNDQIVNVKLGGIGHTTLADAEGQTAHFQVPMHGEARFRIYDVITEELSLNEETAAGVSYEIYNDRGSDDDAPQGFYATLLDLLTIFRPSKQTPWEERDLEYFSKFIRDDNPERPVAFISPDPERKVIISIRGRRLTLEMFLQYGPTDFFLLDQTWSRKDFPRIFDMYLHDPNWTAGQIKSIADTWHEGSLTSAAIALESDLERS